MIVADTSPLNYLLQIQAIDLLPALYESEVVPSPVLEELRRAEAPAIVRAWVAAPPSWLAYGKASAVLPDLFDLDEGESEAIALALELGVREILIDNQAGRIRAESHGLTAIGTLRVLLEAGELGIADAGALFTILVSTTHFRLSQAQHSRFLLALQEIQDRK